MAAAIPLTFTSSIWMEADEYGRGKNIIMPPRRSMYFRPSVVSRGGGVARFLFPNKIEYLMRREEREICSRRRGRRRKGRIYRQAPPPSFPLFSPFFSFSPVFPYFLYLFGRKKRNRGGKVGSGRRRRRRKPLMVSDITCKISFFPSLRLSQFLSEFFSGEMKYYDISALNFEPFSSISSEHTARTSQKYETFSQFSFVGKLMLSNGRSN